LKGWKERSATLDDVGCSHQIPSITFSLTVIPPLPASSVATGHATINATTQPIYIYY
jgi:hypothetical protein